jgi:ComF family protein
MALVSLRQIVQQAVSLLSPALCVACGEAAPGDDVFCFGCDPGHPEGFVDRLPSGLLVVTTGEYGASLAEAVKRLKYGHRPDVARALGRRVARALLASPVSSYSALVPVPLHRARLAERGYNQSALVAGAAARLLGVRHLPLSLARPRRTREQASLGRRDRLVNVEDAFVVRHSLHGLRLVVVDDVVTTGATASACAEALRHAGAEVAAIAAIARARDDTRQNRARLGLEPSRTNGQDDERRSGD